MSGSAASEQDRPASGLLGKLWSGPWPLLITLLGVTVVSLFVNFRRGIWIDEAITMHRTGRTFSEMIDGTFFVSDKPPVYFILVLWWRKLAGGLEWARLVSTGAILLMLVILDRTGRLLGLRGWRSPACLAALLPTVLWASVEARPYSVTILFLAASTFFWLRLFVLESPRPTADAVWFVVFNALAMLSFYYAGFVVAGQFVGALMTRRWKPWVASGAALTAILVPWVPLIIHQASYYERAPMPDLGGPLALLARLPGPTLFRFSPMWGRPAMPVAAAILLLVVIGAALWLATRPWARLDWQLLVMVFSPLVALLALRVVNRFRVEDRHWVILVPGLVVLFANTVGRIRRPLGDWLLVATAGLVALTTVSYVRHDRGVADYRGAVGHVTSSAQANAPAIIFWHNPLPFLYYYRGPHTPLVMVPYRRPDKQVLVSEQLRRRVETHLRSLKPGDDFWILQVGQGEPVERVITAALGQPVEVREKREFKRVWALRLAFTQPLVTPEGDVVLPPEKRRSKTEDEEPQ